MNANQTKEFGGNQIDRNQLNSTTSLCLKPIRTNSPIVIDDSGDSDDADIQIASNSVVPAKRKGSTSSSGIPALKRVSVPLTSSSTKSTKSSTSLSTSSSSKSNAPITSHVKVPQTSRVATNFNSVSDPIRTLFTPARMVKLRPVAIEGMIQEFKKEYGAECVVIDEQINKLMLLNKKDEEILVGYAWCDNGIQKDGTINPKTHSPKHLKALEDAMGAQNRHFILFETLHGLVHSGRCPVPDAWDYGVAKELLEWVIVCLAYSGWTKIGFMVFGAKPAKLFGSTTKSLGTQPFTLLNRKLPNNVVIYYTVLRHMRRCEDVSIGHITFNLLFNLINMQWLITKTFGTYLNIELIYQSFASNNAKFNSVESLLKICTAETFDDLASPEVTKKVIAAMEILNCQVDIPAWAQADINAWIEFIKEKDDAIVKFYLENTIGLFYSTGVPLDLKREIVKAGSGGSNTTHKLPAWIPSLKMAIPDFVKVVGNARLITMSVANEGELLALKGGEIKIRGKKGEDGFEVLIKDKVVDSEVYVTERGVLVGNLFAASVGLARGFLKKEAVDIAIAAFDAPRAKSGSVANKKVSDDHQHEVMHDFIAHDRIKFTLHGTLCGRNASKVLDHGVVNFTNVPFVRRVAQDGTKEYTGTVVWISRIISQDMFGKLIHRFTTTFTTKKQTYTWNLHDVVVNQKHIIQVQELWTHYLKLKVDYETLKISQENDMTGEHFHNHFQSTTLLLESVIDEQGYVSVLSRADDLINVAGHRLGTSLLEQVVASHPFVAECCVVGLPDELKGHVPFALVTRGSSKEAQEADLDAMLKAVNVQIRTDVGAIATLGGLVCARLPKTRSGKTLRRTVKELVENASVGKFDAPAAFPPTIEDVTAVDDCRLHINEYFKKEGKTAIRAKAKL